MYGEGRGRRSGHAYRSKSKEKMRDWRSQNVGILNQEKKERQEGDDAIKRKEQYSSQRGKNKSGDGQSTKLRRKKKDSSLPKTKKVLD